MQREIYNKTNGRTNVPQSLAATFSRPAKPLKSLEIKGF